jgi:hypothetical protein
MYYLSQIFDDDKKDGKNLYDNALSALKKHNDHVFGDKEGKNNQTHILLYNELIKDNSFIEEICRYYKEKDEWFKDEDLILYINNQKNSIPPTKKQNPKTIISKSNNYPDTRPSTSENIFNFESFELTRQVKDIIYNSININCDHGGKKQIFNEGIKDWMVIETPCFSRESFESFAKSLYILVKEKTRDKNPKYNKHNGEPFYIYRFPDEFMKEGTKTQEFREDVDIIRNYYFHDNKNEQEKGNTLKKKREFPIVLKKYLKTPKEPRSDNEFENFQIGVLKEFVNVIKISDQIVINKLFPNKPLNP